MQLSPADQAAEAGWPTSERCTPSGLVVVEDTVNVPKQHLISQVINRRFAPAGELLAIDTWHRTTAKAYSPKAIGRYIDFVKVDSQATEYRWKQVEDHLPEALAAVDRDEAVTDPRHIAILRDCLALHYARSLSTKIVHDRAWRDSRTNRGASLRADEPLLAAAVQSRLNGFTVFDEGTGFMASTALDWVADELLSGASTYYECGRLFRQSVERMYEQAKVWMARSALELFRSESDEFVFGDVPCLTLSNDRPGAGAHQGVALGDAYTVYMAVDPRHIVSLGKVSTFGVLPSELVVALNVRQIDAAVRRVYGSPTSGVQDMVAARRPPQQPVDPLLRGY